MIKGRVKKITRIKKRSDVYDLTVEDNHNFFANNVLLHNSEQALDSHNVCMLSSINIAEFQNEYAMFDFANLVEAGIYMLDAFRLYELEMDRSPNKTQREKLIYSR